MALNNIRKTVFVNIWQHIRSMSELKVSGKDKLASMSANDMVKHQVRVSDWNKRILLFVGRYKTMAEIPDIVPYEVIAKGRNQARIKACHYMMAATVVGCVIAVITGKKKAEKGETLSKRNLDWHKEYNENARKQEELKAKN